MPAWSSYSYVFGPLVAGLAMLLFILILKWSSKKGTSLVAAPAKPGKESEYGMLVVVARPPTAVEGEIWRRTLVDAGIRATLTTTLEGPRLMVWPDDEQRARAILVSLQ